MAVPRELLLTVAVVAAVSCGAVAWVGSTGSWQPLGASRTVLVARPAGHTKNVMSSMREAEHDKRVMIARAVRLEGSIASLARALKRQQTSQLGDAKVPKGDMTVIKRDVMGISSSWLAFKKREQVPAIKASEKRRDPTLVKLRKEQLRLHVQYQKEKAQEARDEKSARLTTSDALAEHKQYEELLVGAAHAKARLSLQRERLAKAELRAHQQRAATLLAQAKAAKAAKAAHPTPPAPVKAEGGEGGEAEGGAGDAAEDADLADEAAVLGISRDAKRGGQMKGRKELQKGVDQAWAQAAQAAARGENRVVDAFCAGQESPGACREALYGDEKNGGESDEERSVRGARRDRVEPCDPDSIGYLKCLGVHATGATLAPL